MLQKPGEAPAAMSQSWLQGFTSFSTFSYGLSSLSCASLPRALEYRRHRSRSELGFTKARLALRKVFALPVRFSPRLSRSIDFGDVFETNSARQTFRPDQVTRKRGTRKGTRQGKFNDNRLA